MSYRCPRCGAIMVCMSTASIPSIISYQCYACGYLSKPVRETELIEILPEHLRQAQFPEPYNEKKNERCIYVDKFKSDIKDVAEINGGSFTEFEVLGILSGQPTADVVEVVRCKDCKHFEYDHPYIIQGVPVLGHEACNAWGDGCKTDENGYCFMAERRTDDLQ